MISTLSEEQISRFDRDGFLIIENFLHNETIQSLRDRLEPLFDGEFETGIYPDEWYWRKGISLPNVTRHMSNAWKSDLTIARVVLSPELGKLTATLAGWPGARLGQDTVWWKAPEAKEIAFHQDSTYTSFIDPPEMITCWVTLDDTGSDVGTIEYVSGSHRWPLIKQIGEFHAPARDYRSPMLAAAEAAGINNPEVVQIEAPAGSCVIHHGNIWHGSGCNKRTDRIRRSLGIHTLSSDAKFKPAGAGYIYGRYKRVADNVMDESFFPILWSGTGYRSDYLDSYCEGGRKMGLDVVVS